MQVCSTADWLPAACVMMLDEHGWPRHAGSVTNADACRLQAAVVVPVHVKALQAGGKHAWLPSAAGQVVARAQHVAGVNFSYQPPPRHLVPFAAALKAPPYANHRCAINRPVQNVSPDVQKS
jgi:hypothetical protein